MMTNGKTIERNLIANCKAIVKANRRRNHMERWNLTCAKAVLTARGIKF
jgi:hypothetical protein